MHCFAEPFTGFRHELIYEIGPTHYSFIDQCVLRSSISIRFIALYQVRTIMLGEPAGNELQAGSGGGMLSEELRVVGAAVLPFCIDPVCGRLYFWLGKERYNAKWAQGSEQWSCFGGKSKCMDEPAERIAAREFVEETAGMLAYFPTDTFPRANISDIEASLRASDYLFRLVFYSKKEKMGTAASPLTLDPASTAAEDEASVPDTFSLQPGGASAADDAPASLPPFKTSASVASTAPVKISAYVLYVKQLEWEPCAARRFRACFKLMHSLPCTVRDPVRLEWLLQHPAIHLVKNAAVQPSALSELDSAARHELTPLAEHISIDKFPCNPPCRDMCSASVAEHPALAAADTRHAGVYPKLVVNKDYFEKQDIALWSVPQLQRACRSNGVLTTRSGRVERCRTSFIKQLCAVMSELAFHAPSMLDESW